MQDEKTQQNLDLKRTSLSLAAVSSLDDFPSLSLTSDGVLFNVANEFVSAFDDVVVIAVDAINEFGVETVVDVIDCDIGMTSSSSSSSIVSVTSFLLSTIDTGVDRPLFGADPGKKRKIFFILFSNLKKD